MVEAGDKDAAELLLEFLAGWLQDHTTVTDKMMGAYVRNYERTHATSAFERWSEARSPDGAVLYFSRRQASELRRPEPRDELRHLDFAFGLKRSRASQAGKGTS